jgi:hypothetical protein
MKSRILAVLGGAVTVGVLALPASAKVSGEYIEARSASVYAGACHYNGELTTAGREAVLAWHITEGKVGTVDLAGLHVIALVTGDDNLAQRSTKRHAVLLVDESATVAQRDALVTLLTAKMGKTLGNIEAVKSAPITYTTDGLKVTVTAGESATLNALKYPCSHCRMPAQTWYTPFAPTDNAQVAQGTRTAFADKTLGMSWSQQESDNVFIGTFTL